MSKSGRKARNKRKRKSSSVNQVENGVKCKITVNAQPASSVTIDLSCSSGAAGVVTNPKVFVEVMSSSSGSGGGSSGGGTQKGPSSRAMASGATILPEVVGVTKELEKRLATRSKECVALFHIQEDKGPKRLPHPTMSKLGWDRNSWVRLPLSSSFSIRRKITDEWNEEVVEDVPRWELIEEELTKLKSTCGNLGKTENGERESLSSKLKRTISTYNRREAEKSNFEMLDDPDLFQPLVRTLPTLVDHCLALDRRLKGSVPILKSGISHTLYLSRNLCCSVLANAFFSTFPDQDNFQLPDINFIHLFHRGVSPAKCKTKVEKLKCILQYFKRMRENRPEDDGDSIISFERRCVKGRQNWLDSDKKLSACKIVVRDKGGIHHAEDMLQVDFANRRVGGGVLNDGLVMEEIRFLISPELIVARLFTEALDNDEVLVVTGTKQFSSYSGYSATFQYKKLRDSEASRRDDLGRECAQVVAIDAWHFKPHDAWTQYQRSKIDRELHKCFVAFLHRKDPIRVRPVATGNWGCGAFNGDPELKFLIQWLAAAHLDRPSIHFYTDSPVQASQIGELVKVIEEKDASVGKVYKMMTRYEDSVDVRRQSRTSIFEFVKDACRRRRWRPW